MSADIEDPRPQKRLRLADDASSLPSNTPSSSDLNNLTRHEEFWFDDGSVVLVARNTGFRVFRSLLAAQSTVFSDMFSSSSPHAEEMFEGCPVVRLSDSPHDIAHFLRVLLPKSQIRLYAPNPCFSFNCISAIIRLAHKYHVQEVLNQATLALEEYFTDDFNVWERNREVVAIEHRHAIAVINLARVLEKPSLLPIAFYDCVRLGGSVLHGYEREDQSVEHLAQDDVIRCIDGRNKLAAKAVALISELFVTQPSVGCKTHDRCQGALKKLLEVAISSDGASAPNVLSSWRNVIELGAIDYDLCDPCKNVVLDRDTVARRKVWGELPEIFDIEVEGWNSKGVGSGEGNAAVLPAV